MTKRTVSPGAEAQIGVIHKVLDRGEVELIDYMGTDEMLCRVARVSTGSKREDLNLLDYLIRHRHTSPVEFGKLVLRVKLPIFVARQWIRHRTGSYSERSLRYQPPLDEFYVPATGAVQGKPTHNKQGRGSDLSRESAEWVVEQISAHNDDALAQYHTISDPAGASSGLPDEQPEDYPGVAAEVARSVLPLGTYTEWYWTTDAHNLMHWLNLRLDEHAQMEIRVYGEVIEKIFKSWLPATHAAFRRYVLISRTFSEIELMVIGRALGSQDLTDAMDELELSRSQVRELSLKIAHARRIGRSQ